MSKSFVIVVVLLFVAGLSFAEDQYKSPTAAKSTTMVTAKKAADIDPLNNVVRMDAQGNRTALCVCGQEFSVTPETKAISRGEQTFYAHNQECYDIYMKTSKEAQDQMMADFVKTKFPWNKMASNAAMKDGKKVATCLCGMQIDVNEKTEHLTENGVTLYLCTEACKTGFHGMAEKDRMAKEMAWIAPAKVQEEKKEAMGTR